MECRICQKVPVDKFYRHLNSCHKKKLGEYFFQFPDQREEYSQEKGQVWNKGQTKESHPSVAKYAQSVKEWACQDEVRRQQSERMRDRYSGGDILDKATRQRVVRAGSQGWVNRLQSSTLEETRQLLSNFTTAGNLAQAEKRSDLTPSDYERLYPWAKGKAAYHHCESCDKQMIVWFGGKPRPKKRFCGRPCFDEYMRRHPHYLLSCIKGQYFYSAKMGAEFYLHSRLEFWAATLMEGSAKVASWCTPPFVIPYLFEDRKRKYYPDFLINGKHVIEVKSSYVYSMTPDKTRTKLQAAEEYCQREGLEFHYWEFPQSNMTMKKVKDDKRVAGLLLG